MRPQNGGRCGQVVAVHRWSFAYLSLYCSKLDAFTTTTGADLERFYFSNRFFNFTI
jgi:hypothetical protein